MTLLAVGYVVRVLLVSQRTMMNFSSGAVFQEHFVPFNIEYCIHRYGEWTICRCNEKIHWGYSVLKLTLLFALLSDDR